jgi:hypothetical protein
MFQPSANSARLRLIRIVAMRVQRDDLQASNFLLVDVRADAGTEAGGGKA